MSALVELLTLDDCGNITHGNVTHAPRENKYIYNKYIVFFLEWSIIFIFYPKQGVVSISE